MKLRIGAFLGAFLFFISTVLTPVIPVHAEAGVILDVKTEISVGDTVKVAIRCIGDNGSVVSGSVKFKFDTSLFSYVSCNLEGAVEENGVVLVTGKQIDITLQAIAEGDAYIRADQLDEQGNSLYAGGVTIKISGGTDSNGGENNNGNGSENENGGNEGNNGGSEGNEERPTPQIKESYVYINDQMYYVSTEHWSEMSSMGFHEEAVMINNIMTSCLQYEQTSILVLHLINGTTGKDEGYFVYDSEGQKVCPFVSYTIDDDTEKNDQLISIQENFEKLNVKYQNLKQKNRSLLICIIIIVAILMIIVIALLLYKRYREEEDYEVDYKRTDGGAPLKRQGEYLNAIAKNSYKDDEGLPKDSFLDELSEEKRRGNMNPRKNMDTEDVEVIDLEDL